MQILIEAEKDDIAMRANGPVEMIHRLAASLLGTHARLIGRIVQAVGGEMAA